MKITLKNITKKLGGATVIHKTDLVISDGSFTTLLGPSGCGKTTLLRMLAGLETPDSGEIWFDDRCIFSHDRKINLAPEKRGLGFVFQDFSLWPHMTIFENTAFGLRASNNTADLQTKVAAALRAVKLDGYAERYPHQLSGGQQQRVAFARAIVIEPHCILFDEPLSALDALLRESMRSELKTLVSKLGITSVFVTHDQIEAMSMSDMIAVLNGGVIQQYAEPENIYNNPATPFVAHFIGKSNWLDQQTMFRPEAAAQQAAGNCQKFDLTVAATQYLGNMYEIEALQNNNPWTITSPVKIPIGNKVSIYIDAKKFIRFADKGAEQN